MAERKLTPKQEKFALAYVETGNASEAYRQAYKSDRMKPQTINRSAFELLENPKIAAMVEELQKRNLEAFDVEMEDQFNKLEMIFEYHAKNPKSAGAAVSAVKEQNQLAGLIVNKHKHEANVVVQELPPLPPDAALAILERIEAERF